MRHLPNKSLESAANTMTTTPSLSCGLLFTISVLLAFPAFARGGRWITLPSGWGQQPDLAAEEAAAARKRASEEQWEEEQRAKQERENSRRNIEAILQEMGPDAYRKYSDHTIAYLGLLLYMRDGFITNSSPAYAYLDQMALIDTGYKVADVTDEGCRIG